MTDSDRLTARVQKIRKSCWDINRQSDEYKKDIANWERIYLTRKISIWVTYFLRNSKITPNQITVLWVFLGIVGAVLLIPDIYWVSILALFLLYVSWVLDNVDGELARYKRLFSITGNLLDMLGHEIIFPAVFCCLTFSSIKQGESIFFIFSGLLATAFVTPVTKMQEKVKLLLCIKALFHGCKPDAPKEPVRTRHDGEEERISSGSVIVKVISIVFSQAGMLYLLIPAVIFKAESIYIAFYGVGIPLLFVPKYLVRSKELTSIAKDPSSITKLFRPEWMDD